MIKEKVSSANIKKASEFVLSSDSSSDDNLEEQVNQIMGGSTKSSSHHNAADVINDKKISTNEPIAKESAMFY